MKSFLMISPYFVPMNYVGAKRALHLAVHLPALGWKPAVVALPEEIEKDPALESLVPDVPMWRGYKGGPLSWLEAASSKLSLRSSKSKETSTQYPGQFKTKGKPSRLSGRLNALVGLGDAFDRFAKYLPWALHGSLRLAIKNDCKLIYCNSGPFSALLLGSMVSGILRLPLVLDLRDPWSIEPNYVAARSPAAQRLVEFQEAWCFRRADLVILNTKSALCAYQAHYEGRIPADKFVHLYNSFDPELYEPPSAAPPFHAGPDTFVIVYYGHLRPTKNAGVFLDGLKMLVEKQGIRPGELLFVTLGETTPEDETRLERLGLSQYHEHVDWVPFTKSRTVLDRADLLLDIMGERHHLQVSGKFFDYLAAARPILSISPNTEMDELLATTGLGERVDPSSHDVYKALERRWVARPDPAGFKPRNTGIERFHAKNAAETIASWFHVVCP